MRTLYALAAATLSALALGCGDDDVGQSTFVPKPVTSGSASADAGGPPVLEGKNYTENDFVESDRNRDPFRGYLVTEQATTVVVPNQRKVELREYTIDELKLQGVVIPRGAAGQAYALIVDPHNVGHSLFKGDWVGKSEVVHTGGANGTDYQLNWRIDRIREAEFPCPEDANDPPPRGRRRICTRFEVNLIREDPPNSTTPPARRTLLVHPELADKAG